MVILTLLAAWAVLLHAPDTPIGRGIRAGLVVLPAHMLSRVTRGRWMALAIVAGLLTIGWWVGRDALTIVATSAPDVVLMLGSVDLSVLADVAVVAVLTWATTRGGAIGARWRLDKRRLGRPARHARRRRTTGTPHAANDDDGEPAHRHRMVLAAP